MKAKISRHLTILASVICVILNSGCFVVTSNHVSKPVSPPQTVEFCHGDYDEAHGWYVRHFNSPDLDFDVSLQNNTERLEIDFWFWVLPIPVSSHSVHPECAVNLDLRPTERIFLVDPWRIEVICTNGMRVAPYEILRKEDGWKPVPRGPVTITKHESFSLKYKTPSDPDIPFKLSIDGIPASGQANSTAIIDYNRSKIVRAGFKLPY